MTQQFYSKNLTKMIRKYIYRHEDLCSNVYSKIIYDNPKTEATQICINH